MLHKVKTHVLVLIFFFITAVNYGQEKLTDAQIEEYKIQAEQLTGKGQKNDAVYYYTKIAYHFWIISESEKSLEYFKKALKLTSDIGNHNGSAGIYSQMGAIYMDAQEYQKSFESYAKALEYYKLLKNKRQIIESLFNYSEAAGNINNLKEAISALEEAKSLCIEINNKILIRNSLGRLAEIEGKSGNSDKQMQYFEMYKNLDREIQDENILEAKKQNEKLVGSIKEETNAIINKKETQLKSTSEELEVQRSINKERMLEIELLMTQNENQQLKLREQEARIKLQKLVSISLAVGFILVSLLAVSLYRGYVQKRKSNDQLSKLNAEITRQKEEIKQQNEELAQKNEKLTALINEKNYVISLVAHDLKSPLNSIKGLLDVFRLTLESIPPKQQELLEMVFKSIDRMKGLISRILDVYAVESKDLVLHLEEIDITEVIKHVVADQVEAAQLKKININTEFENKPYIATLDKDFFYQIIENLVTNAIKFSPFEKKIFISLRDIDKKIRVAIADEGPGISDEDKQKLFMKFQKLSALPTNGESSTGLGLSIVKRYVDAMNGKVWCESEPNKGTSFIMEFNKS